MPRKNKQPVTEGGGALAKGVSETLVAIAARKFPDSKEWVVVGPWTPSPAGGRYRPHIARCEQQEDARRIAVACNAHEELLAACKVMLCELESRRGRDPNVSRITEMAREVIAKSEVIDRHAAGGRHCVKCGREEP